MNKQELIDAIAATTGESKAATGEALDAIIESITSAITKGDAVQLIGFGSFSVGARAARMGATRRLARKFRFPPRRRSSSPPVKRSRTP